MRSHASSVGGGVVVVVVAIMVELVLLVLVRMMLNRLNAGKLHLIEEGRYLEGSASGYANIPPGRISNQ